MTAAGAGQPPERRLSATLDELLDRQADVPSDAAQKDWRYISAAVHGHGRRTAVGMAKLFVRAAGMAHLREPQAFEDRDHFAEVA